ncbi:mitochondrial ribosomal death-associated protein 3-domain-containing protein, partial [Dimargaris cristalligena]
PELLPENITLANVGFVGSQPRELIGKFKPAQFPGRLFETFSVTHSDGLMVREPLCQIAALVAGPVEARAASPPLMLAGPSGAGKSATMLQVISQAHLHNWFVMYLPRASNWVDASQPYARSSDPNVYLQSETAAQWLQFLSKINAKVLETLTLPEAVTLGQQTLEQGAPLAKLLNLGGQQPALAHTVLETLLGWAQSPGLEAPILLAVDQMNAFFISTDYYDAQDQRLQPNQLRLVRSLLPFLTHQTQLQNGLVVGATSLSNPHFNVPAI